MTPSTRIPAQIHAVEKQRVRKWYPLEADAGGDHKSSNVHGELELILEWCYNPELDFDPFCEEDKYPDKPPNEVCVGLGRGRHLAIKDKAVLYGEGSSDPRCTLRIDGTELKEVSQVKKTTLNPIWNETFAFPYSRGPDDSQPPSLVIECEDVDTVTAADFMGLIRVELDPLKDHKRLKKWLPLQARSDDKASSNISGDLEVFVRWRYNPELDFDPYPESELKPAYEDKAPNELRLALVQARGLAVKDKNLLSKGGTLQCPRGAFETFLHAIAVSDASMACELPDSMPSHAPTPPPRHRRDAIGATLSTRCHGTPPQAPRTPSPNSR